MISTELSINRFTLEEIINKTKIPREIILDWEKKTLIISRRLANGARLFNLNQVINVNKKISGEKFNIQYNVHESRPTKYSVIELFAGAGGLALGLSNAGLKSKMLVEIDADAVKTLKLNKKKKESRKGWNIVEDDIRSVDFKGYKNKVDVVTGGFPCQTFSYAGNGKGFGDTRGTLFFEFARCVDEVRPKIAIGENVRGLMKHDGGKTLDTIKRTLNELGYRVQCKLLRSQFFDVGQKRERLIIMAIRKDFNAPFLFPKEKDYIFTLKDVLRNCPKSEGAVYPKRKFEIMSEVPAGGYWRDLPEELAKEYMKGSYYLGGGKTGTARRLSWNQPSLTLVCSPAQGQTERCHPKETRPLTVREYARIQSFPDDWEFEGSMMSKYKQIGNAVPVNVGYYVGRCVISMLSGKIDKKIMYEHVTEEE